MMNKYSRVPFGNSGQRMVFAATMLAVIFNPVAVSRSAAELIDLVLRTDPSVVTIGDTVDVELWFATDGAIELEWIAADVMVAWDPTLAWEGYENNEGMTSVVTNVFPPVPADPNARWWSAAAFSPQGAAPAAGTLVTTLKLLALTADDHAAITVMAGDALGETNVFSENFVPILGALGTGFVEITVPEPSAGLLLVPILAAARARRRGVV